MGLQVAQTGRGEGRRKDQVPTVKGRGQGSLTNFARVALVEVIQVAVVECRLRCSGHERTAGFALGRAAGQRARLRPVNEVVVAGTVAGDRAVTALPLRGGDDLGQVLAFRATWAEEMRGGKLGGLGACVQ